MTDPMPRESGPDVPDRFGAARSVADAVLYEGYVLYPYRASSRKNQVRWQFGVLTPKAFSEMDGSERWRMHTECLVDPGVSPELSVRIRCLHVQHRSVEAAGKEVEEFSAVETLKVDGRTFVAWDEAIEEIIDLPAFSLSPAAPTSREESFVLGSGTDTELIHDDAGVVAGRLTRTRESVEGWMHVEVGPAEGAGAYLKVTVTVENRTGWEGENPRRDDVMGQSLVAVHIMLAIDDGIFVSLLDPPEGADDAVAGCHSDGAYPILIGDDDVVLASPIILYDHPEVAPESPGALYDSLEIDEILALRVLTLTDDEKSEARGTDPRSAAIIDRCDDMPPETWERLHGLVRPVPAPRVKPHALEIAEIAEIAAVPWWDPEADASVDPWTDTVWVAGVEIAKGSAVRLRPSHRSDAQDMFLDGMTATVAGVFKDVDGTDQVAVTIDDDPATVELQWQGRYLFFHPDEVDPIPGRVVTS